jgi:hypothetical protein
MRVGRHLATAIASLLLLAAPGCFVADEMDKAAKLDNSYSAPKKDAPATAAKPGAAKPGAPTKVASAQKPAAPKGASWWETARSLTSEESGTDIARCEVGGRVEYMQREDCLARGGRAE